MKREGPVRNVHLYGVGYVPPGREDVRGDRRHHYGSVRSHG